MVPKYKIVVVDGDGDYLHDDEEGNIFDDLSEAEDYAAECNDGFSAGAEVLELSDPFEYEDEYAQNADHHWEVQEIDD